MDLSCIEGLADVVIRLWLCADTDGHLKRHCHSPDLDYIVPDGLQVKQLLYCRSNY